MCMKANHQLGMGLILPLWNLLFCTYTCQKIAFRYAGHPCRLRRRETASRNHGHSVRWYRTWPHKYTSRMITMHMAQSHTTVVWGFSIRSMQFCFALARKRERSCSAVPLTWPWRSPWPWQDVSECIQSQRFWPRYRYTLLGHPLHGKRTPVSDNSTSLNMYVYNSNQNFARGVDVNINHRNK